MRIIQDNSKENEKEYVCKCCKSVIGILQTDIKVSYQNSTTTYRGHPKKYWKCPVCNYENKIDIY